MRLQGYPQGGVVGYVCGIYTLCFDMWDQIRILSARVSYTESPYT